MRRISQIGLIVALFAATLAFGGTEPLVFSGVEVLLCALMIGLLWSYNPEEPAPKAFPVLVPLGLVGLVLLQIVPLPASLLRLFRNPATAPLQGDPTTLSIDPHLTTSQLFLVLACLAAFYLTLWVSQEREGLRSLVLALLVLGTLEAFYGLVQYLTGWQRIFIYPKRFFLEEATGTYINRNHFAGLLALILPFALAWIYYYFAQVRAALDDEPSRGPARRERSAPQKLLFLLFLTVILFTAVIFSRSRMGIFVVVASILAIITLVSLTAGRARGWVGLGLLVLFLGGLMALWIGLEPVFSRFEQLGQDTALSEQNRIAVWKDTWHLIRQNPWLGTGFGTFPVAITSTQTAFLAKVVNHAHSDYLEFASDLGVPGALLFFSAVFVLLVRCIRRFRRGEKGFRQSVALGCAGSLIALLLFSLTDFNLYIPANALIFSVVLGFAYSSSADLEGAESA